MGSRSYLMPLTTVYTKCNQISNLELRLLQISAEKTLKHCEGAAQVSTVSSEMTTAVDAIKAKYGDPENSSSEEYKQYLAEVESVENEYTAIIESLRDHMEEAEEKIDLQQNTVQTELETIRAEYDEWKKLATEKAGNAGYFDSGSGG